MVTNGGQWWLMVTNVVVNGINGDQWWLMVVNGDYIMVTNGGQWWLYNGD